MEIAGIGIFAIIGFLFAAYAVVGNDALQTLGTFINSNSRLHWFWLFVFAGGVLVATFTYGWFIYDGDPSWERLSNTSKYPAVDIQWYHTLPPLMLLIITRFGVPVSTSFMVLTVFASIGGLTSMLSKSLIGYGLAFVVGLAVYLAVTNSLEKRIKSSTIDDRAPWGLMSAMGILIAAVIYFLPELVMDPSEKNIGKIANWKASAPWLIGIGFVMEGLSFLAVQKFGKGAYWIILQWVTTAYLWGVWLIQDFANIFVFLPRELTALQGFLGLFAILALLLYTFWNQGGPVQKILQAKTAVTDIRSATLIDFIYASLLFFFKEVSAVPMSTTFVFLGLIAGREFGFAVMDKALNAAKAAKLGVSDASKAYIGLVLSINMAVGLPLLSKYLQAQAVGDACFVLAEHLPNQSFTIFIVAANLLLIPVAWFLMKQDSRARMFVTAGALLAAAAVFFTIPPQETPADEVSAANAQIEACRQQIPSSN